MAKNNNKYPHFVENQVLRSSTLNDSFAFVDEQTRLSRVHLFGTGIVEGLGFSAYGNSLVINPGVAVDKDGWLVQFEEKTEYLYAAYIPNSGADFNSDSLTQLLKEGGSHISMVCFKSEEDAKELGLDPISFSDISSIGDYIVALAFGKRNELSTKCSHDRCDINIVNEIIEPWPVLIHWSEVRPLFNILDPIDLVVLPQASPKLENYHGDSASFYKQFSDSFEAWRSEISHALVILENKLNLNAPASSALINVFDDADDLFARFTNVKDNLLLMNPIGQIVPDFEISFLQDLLMAINEFVEEYNQFACKYKTVPAQIPSDRLVYLGRTAGTESSLVYSSLFMPSINLSYSQDCERLQKHFTRICVLSECFVGPIADAYLASHPYKALKINNGVSLSKRPIPFYYDTEKNTSFADIWKADLFPTSRGIDESTSDFIDDDTYGIYLTGYQGKDWNTVRGSLEALNDDLRLSIDIVEAGIKSVSGLSSKNRTSLEKFFNPMYCNTLGDIMDVVKGSSSGLACVFSDFIRCIATSKNFKNELSSGQVSYVGSYRSLLKLESLKETEAWGVIEKMKKLRGISADTFPNTKDISMIYSAFMDYISVCKNSYFSNGSQGAAEGVGKAVLMGPVKRGSRVFVFTKSNDDVFDEFSPRKVVSYAVDYVNRMEPEEEEDMVYKFKIALSKSVNGKKLAEVPDIIYPYAADSNWKHDDNTVILYPIVEGSTERLYSTDLTNIKVVVSDKQCIDYEVGEIANVVDCIPAIKLKMKMNATPNITLSILNSEGATLHEKKFKIAIANPVWDKTPVKSVAVSPSNLSMWKGQKYELSPVFTPKDATNKGVKWGSSDESVARVNDSGIVTCVSPGTAKISAIAADGGKTGYATVEVSSLAWKMRTAEDHDIEFPTIVNAFDGSWRISDNCLLVYIYQTSPSGGTGVYHTENENVDIQVSNPGVLAVELGRIGTMSPYLKIRLIKNGESNITLKLKDIKDGALPPMTFKVNVANPIWDIKPVSAIALSPSAVSNLCISRTYSFSAQVAPPDATEKLIWTSENEKIASVDQKGVVTARKEGTVSILASSASGSVVGRAKVTVASFMFRAVLANKEDGKNHAVIPSVIIPTDGRWLGAGYFSVVLTRDQGQGYDLFDAPRNLISCSVKDSSVLGYSLSETRMDGKLVTMVVFKLIRIGTTNVTLVCRDVSGNSMCSQTFTVNVKALNISVPVTGVSLPFTRKELFVGQASSLSASVIPSNATNKKVKWGVAATSVATVDSNGLLRGVGVGSTRVTVTTEDGSRTASAEIKVSSLLFRMYSSKGPDAAIPSVLSSEDTTNTKPNRMTVYPYINDGTNTTMYKMPITNLEYSASNPGVASFTMSTIGAIGGGVCPALSINFLQRGQTVITLKIKDGSGTVLYTRQFLLNVIKIK